MTEPEFPEPEESGIPKAVLERAFLVLQENNKVLDIRAIQHDRWYKSAGYRFRTLGELSAEPVRKRWIIKNVFARGETSAWIAPPGAMKSALMAEAAYNVACGNDWHGYLHKGTGFGVVYFALERADLVARRIMAHVRKEEAKDKECDHSNIPLVVSDATIDLTRPDAFKKFIATIREANAVFEESGNKVALVIIDTFAKLIAAGGGDENSAKDQGIVFANIQRIKLCEDVHVALVGHTGKDEARGARGSSALLGDVDMMVSISGTDVRTATVTKANDAPEGELFSFKSEIFEFGTDEDGDAITVNIVSDEEISRQVNAKPAEPKLSTNQRVLYRLLHDAGTGGITTDEWGDKAREAGITVKQRVFEARMALKDKGLAREYNGRWFASHG